MTGAEEVHMRDILTVVAALLILAARAGIPIILLFAMGYASERLRRSQEDRGVDTGKFYWLVVNVNDFCQCPVHNQKA